MGTGASTRAQRNLDRLEDRDVKNQKELDEHLSQLYFEHHGEVSKLQTKIYELDQKLRLTEKDLQLKNYKLEKEQRKNTSLMFSDLPLMIMKDPSQDAQLTKNYEMVTITYCDVVNFSSLTSVLKPQDTISIIDQLQVVIDEALTHDDMFIMERHVDGCVAVSGLVEYQEMATLDQKTNLYSRRSRTWTPLSFADSSYGSELGLGDNERQSSSPRAKTPLSQPATNQNVSLHPPFYYASTLATSVLKLMSLATAIQIPSKKQEHLQLRIAMHSGPCSAGIVNLQTATGTVRIPRYKLFGSALHHTARLCTSGLAQQIRVSKQCHKLLVDAGGFKFERCPDLVVNQGERPVESYWLVGAQNIQYPLPSLDLAISLTDYDDLM